MAESAREEILARLRAAPAGDARERPEPSGALAPGWDRVQRIERFRQMIEAAHALVLPVRRAQWPQRLAELLAERGARNLLVAPETSAGRLLSESPPAGLPQLLRYQDDAPEFRDQLFHRVDAALTTARGAIAETGSLVLWPTPEEPRLMSLVPPLHVALLEADDIRETFLQVVTEQRWEREMPTNALLISGPSKTADIEQTLVYGVHGPRELVVLLIEDEGGERG